MELLFGIITLMLLVALGVIFFRSDGDATASNSKEDAIDRYLKDKD